MKVYRYRVNKILYNRLDNIIFLRIWAGDKEYVLEQGYPCDYDLAEATKTLDSKSLLILFKDSERGSLQGFLEIFDAVAIEVKRVEVGKGK